MSATATQARNEWVERVLGVTVARREAPPTPGGAAAKAVRFAPVDQALPISRSAAQVMQAPPALGAALAGGAVAGPVAASAGLPTGAKSVFAGADGKKMTITVGTDGRVSLATPPPPLKEVTFSGGGGKGAALAGAVAALSASGALKDVKTVNGASVGSMTAALIAAGITSEDFEAASDDPTTGAQISDGRSKLGMLVKGIAGDRLSGDALETIVRDTMGESVRKRVAAFVQSGRGSPADVATAQAIADKTSHGGGVTFGDLRTLSKFIPEIKEVNVAATMMGDDSATPGKVEKNKDGKPQLVMFSADTEPDLDVALAVHASAALPPVFDPVNIRLDSLGGVTARFEDGGVMNNAPTKSLVGAERQIDPMPEGGEMTFVFQDAASEAILKGQATPEGNAVNDFFASAPNAAAEYAKNRGLADKPEDVVMVPLTFTPPGKKKPKSFTSLWGGTLAMNMALDDKQGLQAATALETLRHLDKRKLPETREFASATQMLDCMPRNDLAALATDGFPGAKEELAFRDAVTDAVAKLQQTAQGAKAGDLKSGAVRTALDVLDGLAGQDVDRQGFVARELNRGGLDPLLDLARKSGDEGLAVLKGGVAVAESLRAKSFAQTVLREAVYPKMVSVAPKGVDGTVLAQMDAILRKAVMPEDVNDALDMGIRHFQTRTGLRKRPRDAAFATELTQYRMAA